MSLAQPDRPVTESNDCPSLDDVATLLEGHATLAVSNLILNHVNTCTPCRLLLACSLRSTERITTSLDTAGTLQTFSLGETVDERYRITRFISRGGMGEVYEAWDAHLQEAIALKTIVCTGLDNAKLFAKLRAEVQLARRVTHSNVCRILEFGLHSRDYRGQQETIPFFTMELLRGETLTQLMERRGILPETEVLEIAFQTINGLAAVHAAGIVHRDLKPDNVFVLPSESGVTRVVVMDFGLARSVTKPSSLLSSDGTSPVGTPAYMAPEQALGGPPSAAWDIYALGVILFRLLSGRLPFAGASAVAMALARMRDRAPALCSLNPQVRPVLGAVVSRCLEREPKQRFASLAALRQALTEVAATPILPKRAGRALMAWLVVALLGMALLLVRALGDRTKGNGQGERINAKLQMTPPIVSMSSVSNGSPATNLERENHGGTVPPQVQSPAVNIRQMDLALLNRTTVQSPESSARPATSAGLSQKSIQPARISSLPDLQPKASASNASAPALAPVSTVRTSNLGTATAQDELVIPSFISAQPNKTDGNQ